MSNRDSSKSQFVWGKWILLVAGTVCAAGMIYLIWWSFLQTWDWFKYLDASTEVTFVSLAFAVIFQFGQNVCTFFYGKYRTRFKTMQRRLAGYKKTPDASMGDAYVRYMEVRDDMNSAKLAMSFWAFGWVLSASVDAWTNVDQMNTTQIIRGADESKRALNWVWGTALVFFEEGLGIVVSAVGHTINDIREIHGEDRIAWLDLFSDGASSVLSAGAGNKQNQGNRHNSGGSQWTGGGNYRRTTPSQRTMNPSSNSTVPYFHPISQSQGEDEDAPTF